MVQWKRLSHKMDFLHPSSLLPIPIFKLAVALHPAYVSIVSRLLLQRSAEKLISNQPGHPNRRAWLMDGAVPASGGATNKLPGTVTDNVRKAEWKKKCLWPILGILGRFKQIKPSVYQSNLHDGCWCVATAHIPEPNKPQIFHKHRCMRPPP